MLGGLAAAIVLICAAPASVRAGGKLVIKGSDTLGAKMVPQIAEAFKAENPDTTFEIAAEGSSTGVKAIITSTADIGMSSRDVNSKEIAQARSNQVDIRAITVAKDAIAVIVNEKNPLDELTLEQVEQIFTGAVEDWTAVGGRPGRISAYSRNTASGTYAEFRDMAMGGIDYGSDTQKMAGNEQIASEVSRNPSGIGYVGLAYIDTPGVKVVRIDGFAPSKESVNSGNYTLARPLYFLVDGEPGGLVAEFIDFTLGGTGQSIVESVAFIPVK